MSTSTRTSTAAGLLVGLLGLLGLATLTGCGSDEDDTDTRADPVAEASDALVDAQGDSGVPEECAGAFPLAWGEPDPDRAQLPAGWPEPPSGAVLCAVSDDSGSVQTVDYASDLPAAEVLDHYEQALSGLAGYDVSRDQPRERSYEVVLGTTDDGRGFQVDPRDGGFRIGIEG